ncbi:MAG TPA: hypothetical protein VH120_21950 [Gemmataceae bacterium]|nr:hypothetical protein [Gemmataceae bacterium]
MSTTLCLCGFAQGYLLLAAALGQPTTADFSHDFRGGKPLPNELSLFGPDAERHVEQEPEGLRVRPPTAGKITGGWGVVLRYTFTGDFEVTGSYELVTLEQPTKGVGAGVALNALPTLGARKFTKVGRFRYVGDDEVFNAEFLNKDDQKQSRWNSVPATTRAGQLQLKRNGSVMHYLANDAPGGPLREFAVFEYGGEDLSMVRFIANNNGSPTVVDVRLLDMKVAGRLIPQKTLEDVKAAGVPLALIVAGVVAVVLIAAGVRLGLRRRAAAGGPS